MSNVEIVAYATEKYQSELAGFRASAQELCLNVRTFDLSGEWTWEEAVAFKPKFVRLQLEECKGDGILYVDADARFRKIPDFSILNGMDLAFHRFKRGKLHEEEFLTGTVWCANTKEMRSFAEEWSVETGRWKQTPTPEQKSLAAVLERGWSRSLKILNLPPEWCWIFDDMPHVYGEKSPVIEHFQASRRLKTNAKKR